MSVSSYPIDKNIRASATPMVSAADSQVAAAPAENSSSMPPASDLDESPWDEPSPSPVRHMWHVFEVRSEPNQRHISVSMPNSSYRMLCGAVTAVGNTIITSSYPSGTARWVAEHQPVRASAYIVLKVVALVEQDSANPMYETVVRHVSLSELSSSSGFDYVEREVLKGIKAEPAQLLICRGKFACVQCPLPQQIALTGGGFSCNTPIFSSGPSEGCDMVVAQKGISGSPQFKAWAVTGDRAKTLTAYAIGLRVRRRPPTSRPTGAHFLSAKTIASGIRFLHEGPQWVAELPEPHGRFVLYLGSCNKQDPDADSLTRTVELFAPTSSMAKVHPSLWVLQHARGMRSVELRKCHNMCRRTTKVMR